MRFATVSIALSAALLTGCKGIIGIPDDPIACTDIAVASTTVEVVDDFGDPIHTAEVTYSVDGGQERACEQITGISWVCGWEEAGTFEIRADAPYHEAASVTVEVGEDECHVIQEQVVVELPPLICTDEEVASVIVSAVDSGGHPVHEAQAFYVPANEDWDGPGRCDKWGEGQFACGWEIPGPIDVWVEARWYETWFDTVHVDADECHVITEYVDAVMVPMEDDSDPPETDEG